MILKKLEQSWHEIERVGAEAEKLGADIGVRPSWAEEPMRTRGDDISPSALGTVIESRFKFFQ